MKNLQQHVNFLNFSAEMTAGVLGRMEGRKNYSPYECFMDMAWVIKTMIARKIPFFTGDNKNVWASVVKIVEDRANFYKDQAQYQVAFEMEDAGGGVAKLKTLVNDVDNFHRFALYLAQHVAIENWDRDLTPSGIRGVTVAEGMKILFRMINQLHNVFWPHDLYFSSKLAHNVWITVVRNDLKNAYLSMGEATMAGTFDSGDGSTDDLPFSWAGQ